MWGIGKNNLMAEIRMIESKGWLTNVEREMTKKIMENENEDEKNNLTLEKNDERSDVNVENDETKGTNVENGGIDYAYCMYEEPSVTKDEYDLTNIERKIDS